MSHIQDMSDQFSLSKYLISYAWGIWLEHTEDYITSANNISVEIDEN